MGRIVARSRELLDGPSGWGHFGFHTSGQLFVEEYYTLGVIGKAGLGTPHMDGNTRLCTATATAAAALKASFGTDGQPGAYTDVDHCDAIALWGHNVAETQAVLWMRMLDRRRGPNPPAVLAVDPRSTAVTREAGRVRHLLDGDRPGRVRRPRRGPAGGGTRLRTGDGGAAQVAARPDEAGRPAGAGGRGLSVSGC
jgi:predicted molibdopterin-dependent oxidoreductase YjgC